MTKTPKTVRATKPRASRAKRNVAAKANPPATTAPTSVVAAQPSDTKQSQLITLLQSPTGVTIEQMRSLTGWQAHTVRGTISGALRKRLGFHVVCNALTEDGARIYRIVPARASV